MLCVYYIYYILEYRRISSYLLFGHPVITYIYVTCMYRYEAQLEKDWTYILKDSGAKMLLVSTDAIYEKTKGYIGTVRIMT